MPEIEKPLVTFALFAYNQEQYVREAVEGALSQTYSPLQIILSDDCSSDRTFEIIENMAAEYTGPHQILINRNDINYGLGEHLNCIMNEAIGELIVVAAGDDVSLPNRTECLVQAWDKGGMTADSICSAMVQIGEGVSGTQVMQGRPFNGSLSEGIESNFSGLQGATHAWTSRVWKTFGPLLPGSVCEDRIIPLRSQLLGGSIWIDEPLVKYRIHESNISHFNRTPSDRVMSITAEIHRRNSNIYENYLKDLNIAFTNGLHEVGKLEVAIRQAKRSMHLSRLKSEFALATRAKRFGIVAKALRINPVAASRMMLSTLFPEKYEESQRRNLGIIS